MQHNAWLVAEAQGVVVSPTWTPRRLDTWTAEHLEWKPSSGLEQLFVTCCVDLGKCPPPEASVSPPFSEEGGLKVIPEALSRILWLHMDLAWTGPQGKASPVPEPMCVTLSSTVTTQKKPEARVHLLGRGGCGSTSSVPKSQPLPHRPGCTASGLVGSPRLASLGPGLKTQEGREEVRK